MQNIKRFTSNANKPFEQNRLDAINLIDFKRNGNEQ